jgi:DNA-binding response OmpR family regulator
MTTQHLAVVVVTQRPLAQALAHVLAERGYAPRLFSTVASAVEAVRTRRPAVLLVDGGLTRQPGDAAAARLLRLAAAHEVPVIRLPATLARLQDEALLTTVTRSFLAATLPPLAVNPPVPEPTASLPVG